MTDKDQQNAVSLKLPTFWTSQPDVWFEQTEAQFHVRQITADATKYYYVVSSLDQEAAGHIIDFLRHPPADKKYERIKKLLNDTFGLSRRAKASKLLHMHGLGDRRPSDLMNEMLALLDGHKPCLLFEQLFLEQMPDDIRLIIADDDFSDPRKLAARADVLWLARQQSDTAINNAVLQRVSHASAHSDLITEISSANTTDKKKWCYYHRRWGSNARQCRPPCAHPGNSTAGRR